MSIEAALAELTSAVKENTAIHREFAEIARKAATGKSTGEAASDKAAEEAAAKAEAEKKAEAAEKRKAAAAKKKAEQEAAKAAEAEADENEASGDFEVVKEISPVDLRALAKEFMSADDEDERDANKANFAAALKHLGAAKLSEVSDDEDRAKLATYIKAWIADPKAKLSAIDGQIEDALLD